MKAVFTKLSSGGLQILLSIIKQIELWNTLIAESYKRPPGVLRSERVTVNKLLLKGACV